MSPFDAKDILVKGSGTDFDPQVIEAFLSAFHFGEMDVTSAVAYRISRVVGGDECGNDTERDAGDERGDQGEGDDRKIHRHLVQPWYRDPIAHEREQATMAQCRDAQARKAAAGGEHQALRQHLPHQPSTSGTKRGTQPDLALSRRAARQQQVRDVDAADEQH